MAVAEGHWPLRDCGPVFLQAGDDAPDVGDAKSDMSVSRVLFRTSIRIFLPPVRSTPLTMKLNSTPVTQMKPRSCGSMENCPHRRCGDRASDPAGGHEGARVEAVTRQH